MQEYGVDSVVSGQIADWGVMYDVILQSIYDGTWSNEDLWWLTNKKAALLGGSYSDIINPKFAGDLKAVKVKTPDLGSISVYDLVVKRYAQMQETPEAFEPFKGPIYDNKGAIQIPAGKKATKGELLSIMYYVDNVLGDVPSS